MVRELASGPSGSNRGVDAVCGLDSLRPLTLRHFSSGSRRLEVMVAGKNWARERDTRVSLAHPVLSCTHYFQLSPEKPTLPNSNSIWKHGHEISVTLPFKSVDEIDFDSS